ncbi:MAG: hypothetical protein H6838_19600 [Planctomycetes bacterium]|nr:hypothetical protein [Planctomycetota bacterium]
MIARSLAVFSIWLAGLLPVGLAAQEGDPQAPKVVCRMCESRGCFPCTKHGKLLDLELPENGTVFCSVATVCKVCGGSLATDCKTCDNVPVQEQLEQRRKLAQEWLAARKKSLPEVEDRKELVHIKTAHLDLSFSIKPTTVGKTKIDTHPLAHLYATRLEELRTLYMTTFEVPETDLTGRLEVYMFRDAQDHAQVGPRVTGIGTSQSTGVKLMGVECVFSMWQDLRQMPNDEALHRNLVHNVTHLLLSNTKPEQFLGNRKAGWIDEGVAHWFEDKVTGKCTNFCFEEVLMQPGAGFKGGRWRAPVRRMVDAGEDKSFAELSILNTDQLTFTDHALAFAYVDFLLATQGGAKFRDLVKLAKRDQPMREALQTVYGLNPLTIVAPFRQWVKENYSPLEPR